MQQWQLNCWGPAARRQYLPQRGQPTIPPQLSAQHSLHANILGESLRVLAAGGVISIGVPDAERSLQQYVSGDRNRWLEIRKQHPEWCNTPMHSVNYFFRQDRQHGEHKYAYDFETLAAVLVDCGFVNVRRRDWDPTLDLEARRDGTLYADAEKPR
jgi:predicted SAM-dependent methyltransferase